ncbi:MAG: HNH endonuclease [candidate division Zixibacteria bacterium]|nr:HNH endonuclease [candidate division Zixibacteria bacterium]
MAGDSGVITDSRVLVLNQNYEPLSVCSARRALIMQLLGKVEIVETYDGIRVHSIYSSMALPSIVKLGAYVRVPFKKVLLSRKNIIKRDHHVCQYCRDSKGPMTVDHIVPKSFGGKDTWENMVCACEKCNNKKGNRSPERAEMKLLRIPKRPSHITFIQSFIGISDKRWRPYLFLD